MCPIRTLLSLIFLIIATIGQAQNSSKQLKKAYKKNSTELLNQFFLDWNKEIPSLSDVEYETYNDTIKQAYNVFTAFYKPLQIDSLGGSEMGNDIYKNAKYLIVQDDIWIYFTEKINYCSDAYIDTLVYKKVLEAFHGDTVRINTFYYDSNWRANNMFRQVIEDSIRTYKSWKVDSIMNFRPKINCDGRLPLYLTSKYSQILNKFLGNEYSPLGFGGLMNPARATGESEKRKDFLENFIKIWYGHWGGYWQLYSYPIAQSIIFDKDMKYAIVNYKMIYEGGKSILKNTNGNWKLIYAKRTWIE
jgi:hypothetical protein